MEGDEIFFFGKMERIQLNSTHSLSKDVLLLLWKYFACIMPLFVCVCWCLSAVSACERTSKRVPFALCLHISLTFCHCCWLLFIRPFTALNISQISVWVCIKVVRRSRRHRQGAQYLVILFSSSLSASSSLMSNARNIYLQFLNRSYANTYNIWC